MDIKPTAAPTSIPVSDTQRLDSTSRQVDSAERAAFETQHSSAAPATPEAPRAPVADAGEARVGQDPWVGEGAPAQRLLLAGVASGENPADIGTQSLPDAVRAAVDFVFSDTV